MDMFPCCALPIAGAFFIFSASTFDCFSWNCSSNSSVSSGSHWIFKIRCWHPLSPCLLRSWSLCLSSSICFLRTKSFPVKQSPLVLDKCHNLFLSFSFFINLSHLAVVHQVQPALFKTALLRSWSSATQ